ncbi:MAG: DNA gyrase inhibitor YacG [Gammaproteobacteria bacterium]|uniref:DNA gyrase inhibitor YacG n=1 Tax=OM182 bacterium TaxID=2510334 RepID=A0A520S4X5_9GAMM|nr:DNA gyrase inhibitor YacG [Gammaproteobacteria bacterium]OUV67527.1 MAG: DNA gyrase inhibitor YacG [Gammaproteobacteria bacterium TMED133]RZO77500.1 MAG: DNA gyrase inhibitor YacG [OM182 bacterium]
MAELIIQCPVCNKAVAWITSNKDRPFCSDRCRLLDLGEWATGNRTIPADSEHDDVTSSELNKD